VKNGWEVGGEELSPASALIDTGAEVCLVKRFSNQPCVVCTCLVPTGRWLRGGH